MERYSLEKYRKLIENLRLYGSIGLGVITVISGNLLMGLSIALIIGVLDQIFVKTKLKPGEEC
jgi:hypothetical protein